jgi:hypothetical protein
MRATDRGRNGANYAAAAEFVTDSSAQISFPT